MLKNIVARSKDISAKSFSDFYIKYQEHPDYSEATLFTTSQIRQIITKLEVLLFTSKGDVITSPEMGCDLELYIHDFFVDLTQIRSTIIEQINQFIPEMANTYEIDVILYEANTEDNPSNQNIIYIFFLIDQDYELLFQF